MTEPKGYTTQLPSSKAKRLQLNLLKWYENHRRELPWREHKDPYPIWISEVMLQQTTSQAVIPFFKRFLKRFPQLKDLATASIEDVYEQWAGLGYYSRARNLHKAAQTIHERGSFPDNHHELLELSGFGPYTARSVASLAFEEPVGVLDGNVIRSLCRLLDWPAEWWKTAPRKDLQTVADLLVQKVESSQMNQAMMELGATVCTPTSPSCLLCPWQKQCESLKAGTTDTLPLSKPKKERVLLKWSPQVVVKGNKIATVENHYAPFLKKSLLLPGEITPLKKKITTASYKHSITKYDIFVDLPQKVSKTLPAGCSSKSVEWLPLEDVRRKMPYNLVLKALKQLNVVAD